MYATIVEVLKALLILAAITAAVVTGSSASSGHAESTPRVPYWRVAKMNKVLTWNEAYIEGLKAKVLQARCAIKTTTAE